VGILGQAALLHDHCQATWPAYGRSQNDSIKALGCKCWWQHNWERFRRNIHKARDGKEELLDIRKQSYRSPQQQTYNLFSHNMGN